MEENIKITNDIIKAVYAHISKRYNIDNIQVFEFITKQANLNNQSREQYILYYYENIKLKIIKIIVLSLKILTRLTLRN